MTRGGPLSFWDQKVKVRFGLQTFYRFRTITPFPCDIQWWNFTRVDHNPRMPLLIFGSTYIDFGSKGQGQIWTSNFLPFPHDNFISLWHTMRILHICVANDLTRTSIDFGVKRSKVNFVLQTLHRIPTIISPTIMILHTCCLSPEDPYCFRNKSSRLNLKSLNLLPWGYLSLLGSTVKSN